MGDLKCSKEKNPAQSVSKEGPLPFAHVCVASSKLVKGQDIVSPPKISLFRPKSVCLGYSFAQKGAWLPVSAAGRCQNQQNVAAANPASQDPPPLMVRGMVLHVCFAARLEYGSELEFLGHAPCAAQGSELLPRWFGGTGTLLWEKRNCLPRGIR